MKFLKRITKSIGPGFITGVADDDPSGIVTYAQTGAIFGLSQLWMTLYSIPLMVAVQEMCARIGMITGKGIAGVIKAHYPRKVLLIAVALLGVANIINIGADLGAMGQALSLVAPFPFGVSLIILTLFTLVAAIYIPYHLYAKVLKYLAATVFSYVVAAFLIKQDWGSITLATLIPHIEWNREFLLNTTAFLGTTISPYLFFWQADEEVEEEIEKNRLSAFGKGHPNVHASDLRKMQTDTITGMTISNLIAFFIIITASGALTGEGTHTITSATELAEALRPLAGDFAVYLFAFGILGTGLLAIPVLAGAVAYAVAETLNIPLGLSKTFKQATGFYTILTVAILVGVLLNFINIDPILMLYYAAAANGILAAPLLVIILFIANNKKILGERTNSRLSNSIVIVTATLMGAISLFTIESFFK